MTKARVDFFKPSGKWWCTEEIEWVDDGGLEMSLQKSIHHHLLPDIPGRLQGMYAVCLSPPHLKPQPIMVVVPLFSFEL